MCRATWDIRLIYLMSFITFKGVNCTLIRRSYNVYMKRLSDFYSTLHVSPGNLARITLSYKFHALLVHYSSYEHLYEKRVHDIYSKCKCIKMIRANVIHV